VATSSNEGNLRTISPNVGYRRATCCAKQSRRTSRICTITPGPPRGGWRRAQRGARISASNGERDLRQARRSSGGSRRPAAATRGIESATQGRRRAPSIHRGSGPRKGRAKRRGRLSGGGTEAEVRASRTSTSRQRGPSRPTVRPDSPRCASTAMAGNRAASASTARYDVDRLRRSITRGVDARTRATGAQAVVRRGASRSQSSHATGSRRIHALAGTACHAMLIGSAADGRPTVCLGGCQQLMEQDQRPGHISRRCPQAGEACHVRHQARLPANTPPEEREGRLSSGNGRQRSVRGPWRKGAREKSTDAHSAHFDQQRRRTSHQALPPTAHFQGCARRFISRIPGMILVIPSWLRAGSNRTDQALLPRRMGS